MFQVTSEMIEKLKDALRLQPVPAVNGPQIYYACSACMGTCKNSCSGTCRGAARVAVHVPAKVTAGEKQRAALAQEPLLFLWGERNGRKKNKNGNFDTYAGMQPFVYVLL